MKFLIILLLPILSATEEVEKVRKGVFLVDISFFFGERDVDEEYNGEEISGNMYSTRAVMRVAGKPVRFLEAYGMMGAGNVYFGVGDMTGDYITDFTGSYELLYGGGISISFLQPEPPSFIGAFLEGSWTGFKSRDRVQLMNVNWVKEVIHWQELEMRLGLERPFPAWYLKGGIKASELFGTDTVEKAEYRMRASNKIGLFFLFEVYLERSQKTAFYLDFSAIDSNYIRLGIRKWL